MANPFVCLPRRLSLLIACLALAPGLSLSAQAQNCAAEVSAGDAHTCVVRVDGLVYCAGRNTLGQLGDGTKQRRTTPVRVSGLSGVVHVSAGRNHTCAVKSDGTVWCWGSGSDGQTGADGTQDQLTPVQVQSVLDAVDVGAGSQHSCARTSTGVVLCWGTDIGGELTGQHLKPAPYFTGAERLAVGWFHTCAVGPDHVPWCWGSNTYGQLGDGTTVSRPVPAPVIGAPATIFMAGGSHHTCAIDIVRAVRCFGSNASGQLGDTSVGGYRTEPFPVPGFLANPVAAGDLRTCAIRPDGVWCWGQSYGPSPVQIASLQATAITAGGLHQCVLHPSKAVYCWGDNSWGQLGVGSSSSSSSPVQMHLPCTG